MELNEIVRLAENNGWDAQPNARLSAYTTFKVGGPADLLVTLPDGKAAATLLAACREKGIPTLLLGNGSNLLVGDRGVRGVVWRLDPKTAACTLASDGMTVFCDAGLPLMRLCRFAEEKALSGMEFAFGIPGTVGGAVFMNAGAYDGQMSDVLVSAEVLEANGELHTVVAEQLQLGYRHSVCMDTGAIVLGATLKLTPGNREEISAKMRELLSRRREKQPLEFPSAGSFFKRPTGHFAGALIENGGLKGFSVGGAKVSEKHAGFVINTGDATAKDICTLAEEVTRRVKEQFGVTLEPEVRFVGEF